MSRVHMDANVILRFLRNDDRKQSPLAAELFRHAQSGGLTLIASPLILMEVFYVLAATYKIARPQAAKMLATLLSTGAVICEDGGVTLDALHRITTNKVAFGDAHLAATAAQAQEEVASFDKDMTRFADVRLFAIHKPASKP